MAHLHRYDFHHYMRRARRGPSRLLWFAVGAVTVTWWMKARAAKVEDWDSHFAERQLEWRKRMEGAKEHAGDKVSIRLLKVA